MIRGELIFFKIEAECLLDLLQVIALQLDLFLLDLGRLYESCRNRMRRHAQPLELLGLLYSRRVRVTLFLKKNFGKELLLVSSRLLYYILQYFRIVFPLLEKLVTRFIRNFDDFDRIDLILLLITLNLGQQTALHLREQRVNRDTVFFGSQTINGLR